MDSGGQSFFSQLPGNSYGMWGIMLIELSELAIETGGCTPGRWCSQAYSSPVIGHWISEVALGRVL